MKTFMDVVKAEKEIEIRNRSAVLSLEALREKASDLPPRPSFVKALTRAPGEPLKIIAEVKAKAPGRENVGSLKPAEVVREYEQGGASAISCLTDPVHFGGSLELLEQVGNTTSLPILHKEFVISPYQLLEGRLRGASAALILSCYYDQDSLRAIIDEAEALNLAAVVECSLESELPLALEADPEVLLINNRPIAAIPADPTQGYDKGTVENVGRWLETHAALQEWRARPGNLLISASCISAPEDCALLGKLPIDAVLIGNAAMTAQDRPAFLKSLSQASLSG